MIHNTRATFYFSNLHVIVVLLIAIYIH